jgi:hypothetical protein
VICFLKKSPQKKPLFNFEAPNPKKNIFCEILYQKIKLCVWLRIDSFLISKSFQIVVSQEHSTFP